MRRKTLIAVIIFITGILLIIAGTVFIFVISRLPRIVERSSSDIIAYTHTSTSLTVYLLPGEYRVRAQTNPPSAYVVVMIYDSDNNLFLEENCTYYTDSFDILEPDNYTIVMRQVESPPKDDVNIAVAKPITYTQVLYPHERFSNIMGPLLVFEGACVAILGIVRNLLIEKIMIRVIWLGAFVYLMVVVNITPYLLNLMGVTRGWICIWPVDPLYMLLLFSIVPVLGIWFGGWGVIAAYLGTTIPLLWVGDITNYWSNINQIYGGVIQLFLLSSFVIPAALIPAWAFRRFNADPRLKTASDVKTFLFYGIFLGGVVSVFTTPLISYLFGFLPWGYYTKWAMPNPFFLLFSFPLTAIIGFPILKACSGIMLRTKAYCKGWFS